MILFVAWIIRALSQSCVTYLPRDLVLSWSFNLDDTIVFSLDVPKDLLADYGWVGVGFKPVNSEEGLVNADLVNIIFGHSIRDCFGQPGGPVEDTKKPEGSDDLKDIQIDVNDQGATYTWHKKLSTKDPYDIKYKANTYYRLLYAYGQMLDGVQQHHKYEDRGTVDIYLSNSSIDLLLANNSD